jgi:hypothetical protein
MNNDDETEAAAESSRSYCVFERDRALPRPTSRSALANDANLSPQDRGATRLAIKIGLGLSAVALLWWLA